MQITWGWWVRQSALSSSNLGSRLLALKYKIENEGELHEGVRREIIGLGAAGY